MPDERCRVLRRRLARRQQLVWARTRAKNQIHAVLARRLQARPPCADLFGVKGRAWLGGLTLPIEEGDWTAYGAVLGGYAGLAAQLARAVGFHACRAR